MSDIDTLEPAIETLELTKEQERQWGDTMSLMLWACPGFRHLFYKLLAAKDGKGYGIIPTNTCPIAATDGKHILINPDGFFKFALKERVFIIAHEIVHNVYDDISLLHRCVTSGTVPMNDGTTLPFKDSVMQKAMDYRINAMLVESDVGDMPSVGCYDLKVSDGKQSVLDVYRKLYEDDPDGDGDGKGGFDLVLSPGTSTGQSPSQAMGQRSAQQWAVEVGVAQHMESMRRQGKMPGGLSRMFKEILEPEVPWTEHIQAIFNRRVGSGSYNWRRPDRRFIVQDIHMPSRSGHGAGWIVVWGDTSGSIGDTELNAYMGELAGVIEDVKPRRLTVLWCDAQIHHVDELEEVLDLYTIKARGVGGRGGTSVDPVFEWIADHTEVPDMFIGFTDGCVTFPKIEPAFPVIWATVEENKYPWGEVVKINQKK